MQNSSSWLVYYIESQKLLNLSDFMFSKKITHIFVRITNWLGFTISHKNKRILVSFREIGCNKMHANRSLLINTDLYLHSRSQRMCKEVATSFTKMPWHPATSEINVVESMIWYDSWNNDEIVSLFHIAEISAVLTWDFESLFYQWFYQSFVLCILTLLGVATSLAHIDYIHVQCRFYKTLK